MSRDNFEIQLARANHYIFLLQEVLEQRATVSLYEQAALVTLHAQLQECFHAVGVLLDLAEERSIIYEFRQESNDLKQ